MEPVEIPVEGVLDLHTFRPSEVKVMLTLAQLCLLMEQRDQAAQPARDRPARALGAEAGDPLVQALDTGGNPYQVALSADGSTLAVGASFDYVKGRLGIRESDDIRVASEFDYARQALLYLPRRMPLPRDERFADIALRGSATAIPVGIIARWSGARVIIAHASQPEVVDLAVRERARGGPVRSRRRGRR